MPQQAAPAPAPAAAPLQEENHLTAAEQQFFATGVLPAELGSQPAHPAPSTAASPTPPAAPGSAPPTADSPPVPTPAAAPDATAELQRQLASERARFNQLDQRLREMQEQLKPQAPAPQAPDPTTDPLGHLMHQISEINKQVTDVQSRLTQEQQQQSQQKQFQDFVTNMKAVKEQFIKTAPDFNDAYQHLRNTRAQDLRDVGVAEDQVQEALFQDEMAVAMNAVQQGRNPAEVIYNMAKRYGYATKPAPPAAPANKLQTIQDGMQHATTPQHATPAGELTLDALKDAGDADITAVVLDDKQWQKVVGGRSSSIF